MRVDIYNEGNFTADFQVVTKTTEIGGQTFVGAQFFLEPPDALHHTADDDDRLAVTFWSVDPADLAELFRKAANCIISATLVSSSKPA